MPCFSPKRINLLQDTIRDLHRRVIHHHRSGLTNDDVIQLFVRPEHRELVREVAKVARNINLGGEFTVSVAAPGDEPLKVTIAVTRSKDGFLVPDYAGTVAFDVDEGEAGQRLLKWVKRRLQHSKEWTLTLAVFNELAQVCTTPKQMRFLWPSIVALLGMTEGLESVADSVREFKAPSDLPSLHPALRDACRETSTVISRALLLPKIGDSVMPTAGPITLRGGFYGDENGAKSPCPWRPYQHMPQLVG
jgi:hypothetical protein